MPIRAPATKPTLTESCAASSTPSASRLNAKTITTRSRTMARTGPRIRKPAATRNRPPARGRMMVFISIPVSVSASVVYGFRDPTNPVIPAPRFPAMQERRENAAMQRKQHSAVPARPRRKSRRAVRAHLRSFHIRTTFLDPVVREHRDAIETRRSGHHAALRDRVRGPFMSTQHSSIRKSAVARMRPRSALHHRALPDRVLRDQSGPAQAAQVMTQGRAGHAGRALDVAHGESVVSGPDQQTHDGQPGLVAELGEDGGRGFQAQSHEAGC